MKKSESGYYTIYESTDPNALHEYSQALAKELESRDIQIDKDIKLLQDEMQEEVSEAVKNIEDLKGDYNENALTKKEEYDINTEEKIREYNSNAESKKEEYNKNAESLNKKITELENENKLIKEQIPSRNIKRKSNTYRRQFKHGI